LPTKIQKQHEQLTAIYRMIQEKLPLIVILGPTASGKTAVAANLAFHLDGEIISADSRQVYRSLNLGTGKDYADYTIHNINIPYHLIDIAAPGTQYNVFEYQKDFFKIYHDILERGKTPILCGGTGMYIEAVLEGYKLIQVPVNSDLRKELENKSLEELITFLQQLKTVHATTDIENKKRAIRAIEIELYYSEHPKTGTTFPEINPLIIGVRFDRATERQRITQRLEQRLKDGMLAEIENLLNSGLTEDQLVYYGLEYKFLTLHVTEKMSYDEMFTLLNTAIHQFAKRQMTWFRRMERKGYTIHWIDGYMPIEEKMKVLMDLYAGYIKNIQ
jgi:tRNA dimethylallyltransferase